MLARMPLLGRVLLGEWGVCVQGGLCGCGCHRLVLDQHACSVFLGGWWMRGVHSVQYKSCWCGHVCVSASVFACVCVFLTFTVATWQSTWKSECEHLELQSVVAASSPSTHACHCSVHSGWLVQPVQVFPRCKRNCACWFCFLQLCLSLMLRKHRVGQNHTCISLFREYTILEAGIYNHTNG